MRMPVFAFLVAESDADVVHPAWNNRFVHVVGLYGDDVSAGVAGGQHRDAVFAIVLPWIRLYHSQHRVFCSLHDVMDFNHFFQGLGVFNMLHMLVGGCLGCAVYAKMIGWYVADGFRAIRAVRCGSTTHPPLARRR